MHPASAGVVPLLLLAALAACDSPPPSPIAAPPSASAAPAGPLAAAPEASAAPAAGASAALPEREIAGAAHILVAYKGALGAPKTITRGKADAKTRAEEARAKLASGKATFEELVAQYSDDALSKNTGGKIGVFEKNVFPPAFSDATFALAVGDVSDVVETARGFHVIRRTR